MDLLGLLTVTHAPSKKLSKKFSKKFSKMLSKVFTLSFSAVMDKFTDSKYLLIAVWNYFQRLILVAFIFNQLAKSTSINATYHFSLNTTHQSILEAKSRIYSYCLSIT
jgi:hypothetical protein